MTTAIRKMNINHERRRTNIIMFVRGCRNFVAYPLPLRGVRDWWKFSSGGGRNLRLLMSLRDPLAAYSRRLAINQDLAPAKLAAESPSARLRALSAQSIIGATPSPREAAI
jgi:hypothetical protein